CRAHNTSFAHSQEQAHLKLGDVVLPCINRHSSHEMSIRPFRPGWLTSSPVTAVLAHACRRYTRHGSSLRESSVTRCLPVQTVEHVSHESHPRKAKPVQTRHRIERVPTR